MFDPKKLVDVLGKNYKFHRSYIISDKEVKFSIFHKKSKFLYEILVLSDENTIFLDFANVYNDKKFNHEIRIQMSEIALRLIDILKENSKQRIRLLSGTKKVSFDWLIIKDIENYKKRCEKEYFEEHKYDILSLFEQSIEKTKEEKIDETYEYDLFLAGEDGLMLFDWMKELGIAQLLEKRKVDIKIKMEPVYLSKKKGFIEMFVQSLKEKGFQVILYHRKKAE